MVIVNRHMMAAIQLHETLHILCTVRSMGTDDLKDKLLHQLMALREEVLHDIFLYVHKSYDTL